MLNVRFWRSKDGGKSFSSISVPHGDNHDLWLAPDDPKRMIESNDGGANVSFDGGETWSTEDNQPTAQIYRVSTDNDFPYRLLGGAAGQLGAAHPLALGLRRRHRRARLGADRRRRERLRRGQAGRPEHRLRRLATAAS